MSESGLVLTQMDKIKFRERERKRGDLTLINTIQLVEVNSYLYLNGFKTKKRVSTSKTKIINASSIPFNVVYAKCMRKTIPNDCLTTKI